MEPEDIQGIFDEIPRPNLEHGLSGLIAFLIFAQGGEAGPLEDVIESGVFTANSIAENGSYLQDVDVSIMINREPNIEHILEKHENGPDSNLTNSELGLLVRSGAVDLSELDKYMVE